MKRLKTFGVAAAMALVLTALGAGSASAALFHSASAETTWKGEQTNEHVLSLGGESIRCTEVPFTGTTFTKDSTEITVSPQLKNCGLVAGMPKVNWAMNGCKFRLHGSGSMDIVGCEKPMTFTVPACVIEIGNQTNIQSVGFGTVTEGELTALSAGAGLSGFTYTRKSSGGCSSSLNGTFSDGVYTGQWRVKGYAPGGAQTSVSAVPTEFAVEEAPATISGKKASVSKIAVFKLPAFFNTNVGCNEHTLAGEMAAKTAESIAVTAAYAKCTISGLGTSISMGGCSYVLHLSGAFDIVGATCAANPITISFIGCVATVGPQSGLSGLTYTNEEPGSFSNVTQAGEATGVKYTTSGKPCEGGTGTFTDGAYRATDTFSATNKGGKAQNFWIK
jgi:hypothetical protein